MNPRISIIVPVYNVEKYIQRCVESLIAQDYNNLEIILIDDGSKDKSGSIIDGLAAKDNRIKVVHQDNKGVSVARNTGINNASGAFILFVDGDDWVEKNYVSYFYDLIEKNHCKIAMNTSNFTGVEDSNDGRIQELVVSSETAIKWIFDDTIFVAVWNKIYAADLLKKYSLHFSEDIWYGEGMLFNIDCLQCVDEIAVGNKKVYHQTFNPDSAMRSFNLSSNYCGICSMWLQRAHCKKWNRDIELEWLYHRYRFNRTILDGIIRTNSEKENKYVLSECISFLRKDLFMALRRNISMKQKALWICYSIFPLTMARRNTKKFKIALKKFCGGGVLNSLNISCPIISAYTEVAA